MPRLFRRNFTREEIAAHVGDLSQVAGVRMMTLSNGQEDGVRIADVRTGSGFRFQVTLDRGMDISVADYKGIPLAWRSPVGDVHPAFFDPQGFGWLRSFPGGLMTGCGLTYLGAPCVDEGESLGLHGRLSHLPARDVQSRTEWVGEECKLIIEGTLEEFHPFREHLTLRRTIEATLGESSIIIRDTVRNDGPFTTPLMMLYHVNVGWPVVDDGARIFLRSRKTVARDEVAASGLDNALRIEKPQAGYSEQVFYHDLVADADGHATVVLRNETLDLGVFVHYRQAELPRFAEWKMMGAGTYVVGLEPANCAVSGRAAERAQGTLQFLPPGEDRHFAIQIGIVDGHAALDEYITNNSLT
jgi:hypothetical protein